MEEVLPGDLQNQILPCQATTTTCRTRSRPSQPTDRRWQHPAPGSSLSIYRAGMGSGDRRHRCGKWRGIDDGGMRGQDQVLVSVFYVS